MDILPTIETFGIGGLIVFFMCFVISVIILFNFDIWMFITVELLFLGGAYCGRTFENNYHKEVLEHMDQSFQDLYKATEYSLASKEVEKAKRFKEGEDLDGDIEKS
jgi:hypothetical protein